MPAKFNFLVFLAFFSVSSRGEFGYLSRPCPLPEVAGVSTPPLEKVGDISDMAKEYLAKEWSHLDETERSDLKTLLEEQVFADPEFQKDPGGYLRGWQSTVGGFEPYRPDDPARKFLIHLKQSGKLEAVAAEAKRRFPKLKEGVTPASAKWIPSEPTSPAQLATDYYLKKRSHYSEEERQETLTFLEERVFPDPQFQHNPLDYLKKWEGTRNGFEILTIPDRGRYFLEYLREKGELEKFAAEVKRHYQGVKPGVTLHSTTWSVEPSTTTSAPALDLAKMAYGYANQYYGDWEEPRKRQAHFFLENSVYPDPLFQNNPEAYLLTWYSKRRNLPAVTAEDLAQHFLMSMRGTPRLAEVASLAKKLYPRAKPGVPLLAPTWNTPFDTTIGLYYALGEGRLEKVPPVADILTDANRPYAQSLLKAFSESDLIIAAPSVGVAFDEITSRNWNLTRKAAAFLEEVKALGLSAKFLEYFQKHRPLREDVYSTLKEYFSPAISKTLTLAEALVQRLDQNPTSVPIGEIRRETRKLLIEKIPSGSEERYALFEKILGTKGRPLLNRVRTDTSNDTFTFELLNNMEMYGETDELIQILRFLSQEKKS